MPDYQYEAIAEYKGKHYKKVVEFRYSAFDLFVFGLERKTGLETLCESECIRDILD